MVIVLVIIVFVVMASVITRAVPWMFETEVIWGIVAIETIYTKTVISRGAYPHFPLFATGLGRAAAARFAYARFSRHCAIHLKKGHA
ncbi:hypothetical protein ACFSHT_01550 [Paraburkholderia silviterrae]|uniref:hypothetical protein n=1 Tax=Paraburkholderia silviterrae TaxID=2528715 RepID=UPI001404F34E|nr:hypothetical protein [Paraburkholderia silviterrae]